MATMTFSQPLVSIVIPCFNTEKYIGEAIESALSQTYANKEVIVVDDGSSDKSLAVIQAFGERIRWLSGANVGAAEARNKGVAVARGELLQFLDADDLLYPQKLAQQVPLSVEFCPGMVFCDADVVDLASNRHRGRWGTGSVSTEDAVIHTLRTVVQTSGPLHWRESFERVGGFRSEAGACDDRDLHLRLACAGIKFHHISNVLYMMRRMETSLTKRDPIGGLRVQYRIGEDAFDFLDRSGALNEGRRASFAGFFAGTGRRAFRLGATEFAKECFYRAREIHPEGGISQVYSMGGQVMARLVGVELTEYVSNWKRFLVRDRELA
jgi:glycosyltransferase involved in cell wall biosynthesis